MTQKYRQCEGVHIFCGLAISDCIFIMGIFGLMTDKKPPWVETFETINGGEFQAF